MNRSALKTGEAPLKKIALIGECMLELSRTEKTDTGSSLQMAMSYGGDTLNTAVYLARLGVNVDYVTALGDDNMSDWMIAQWQGEGVGCDLVEQRPGCVPGLYLIELDEQGERTFHYWRDNSPARRLLDDSAKAAALFEVLGEFQYLCLSGITLAILGELGRQHLFQSLELYRQRGGKVVFDDNYRPRLWPGEAAARQAYATMYQLTDIALPTLDDEQKLFGQSGQDAVIERLQAWGVNEIALKMDEQGCLIVSPNDHTLVASCEVDVVDTTSAGDSFNAGYLAARMRGSTPKAAAAQGHQLASVVIQHRGAIIPVSAMPAQDQSQPNSR